MIRQGDVLLRRIDRLPKGLNQRDDKVLAYGEVTGHSHKFESEDALVFANSLGQQFVQVLIASELLHEEHKSILVPEGTYEVVIQREYDIQEGIRQVLD